MNEGRIESNRPTMSGGSILESLTSSTSRADMTDNVYEAEGRDPGMDIDSTQPDRAYDGEEESYSSGSPREVNIRPLSSGYLVNVGCQSVAVETTEKLLSTLGDYLNDPAGFERKWYKNKNRNKLQ